MQKITPFLWFDDQAEEAVNFYVSIFKKSKITGLARYEEESAKASGRPQGSVMTVAFELNGQEFVALNGGPLFKFTEAISFVVNCVTQEEVDHFWEKLSAKWSTSSCVTQFTTKRSEEHTSELQSLTNIVCRLLLEK